MSDDAGKQAAALRAAEWVQSGMRLGLGTGSTASLFVKALGRRVRAGLDIVGAPTSEATRRLASGEGIRLTTMDETPELDLTVDGADELDPNLALIKGGGGALLREKLVAGASREFLVIADQSKLVERLGRFPLPVEIVTFGWETTRRRVAALLSDRGLPTAMRLRTALNGSAFVTDEGHWILDLELGAIADPAELATALKGVLGVVEHGLFVGFCRRALIGSASGVMDLAATDLAHRPGR